MKIFGKMVFEGQAAMATSYTQAAHGLAVGDVVRLNGSTYVKARADTVTNAEMIGVVDSVAGDTFSVAFPGAVVTGLSGLTAGGVSFLSTATAGLAVTTDAGSGFVSKPVWVAVSTTTALVLNSRGVFKVPGTTPATDVYNESVGLSEVNGTLVVFTLAQTPAANSLRLVVNGLLRREGVDYTLNGVTITFSVAPPVDSLILASYEIA